MPRIQAQSFTLYYASWRYRTKQDNRGFLAESQPEIVCNGFKNTIDTTRPIESVLDFKMNNVY
jgi:hypothetical protein